MALQYGGGGGGTLQIELELECRFLRSGENWSTRRKTSRSKDENQQQTQPTYNADSGTAACSLLFLSVFVVKITRVCIEISCYTQTQRSESFSYITCRL